MNFLSHSDPKLTSSFGNALLASLAPDGGLWMPEALPRFTEDQMAEMAAMDFADCAATLATHFVGDDFDVDELRDICRDAYDFPLPLITDTGQHFDPAMTEPADHYFLELFHGPTLAFKDFAARFMARAVSRLIERSGEQRTILVATSGDTGGAIGYAFHNQSNIKVVILYPESGVSEVQEQQLTTIGDNVSPLRVQGSFDDCQALVKQAFGDKKLAKRHNLMSANSINVGRVIPQSFYYVWTALRLKAGHPGRPLVISVPSGNLGNVTGGLMAQKMGAPIDHFVVGHNANDPLVDYLRTAQYTPRDSVPTLSNAMDIGRPNNFARIQYLFDGKYKQIAKALYGASFSDAETERHMRHVHSRTGYVMCPHTTVGNLALRSYMTRHDGPATQVTVATAHPAKFRPDVERVLREDVPLPDALGATYNRAREFSDIEPNMKALVDALKT